MYTAVVSVTELAQVSSLKTMYIGNLRYAVFDTETHPTVARLKYNAIVEFESPEEFVYWWKQDRYYTMMSPQYVSSIEKAAMTAKTTQ